ncbi:MAG TPA: methyltransferase domain-containing protein [Longimicrobiales bacterium]
MDPTILSYYALAPEESRLQHNLEELRTRVLVERHIPAAPADVFDVGGAAGVYAFWLAELGYRVHLVDATECLVEEARHRNESAIHKLASVRVGDARALPFEDHSADVVLMLGPLYHLTERDDRVRALREGARVLRRDGVLIAAAISRWASLLDGLKRNLISDPVFAGSLERDLVDGQHRNPTSNLEYFTTSFFHRPDELREEVLAAGLTLSGLFAVEGPAWLVPDLPTRWADDAQRELILKLVAQVEQEPELMGASAHVLAVARKRA